MNVQRLKQWSREAAVMLLLVLIATPLICAVVFAISLPIVGFWWLVFRFVTTGELPSWPAP